MTPEEAQELPHGLYVLHWANPAQGSGASLAAVGSLDSGSRWFAPINWLYVPSLSWSLVESVTLILEQADLRAWQAGKLPAPPRTERDHVPNGKCFHCGTATDMPHDKLCGWRAEYGCCENQEK